MFFIHRITVLGTALMFCFLNPLPVMRAAAEQPGDREILIYDRPGFQGPARKFRLPPQRSQLTEFAIPVPASIRVGRDVAAFLTGASGGKYTIFHVDHPDTASRFDQREGMLIVFPKGKQIGTSGNASDWARPHPQGALFSNHRLTNTLIGGSHDYNLSFFGWDRYLDDLDISGLRGNILNKKQRWMTVYDPQTLVTIHAVDGPHRFTTGGQARKEFDLASIETDFGNLFDKMTIVEIGQRKINLVGSGNKSSSAGKTTSTTERNLWKFANGEYRQRPDGRWEVIQSGKRVFVLNEHLRTDQYVELRSDNRLLWVRLSDNKAEVLDLDRQGSDWLPQYTGAWQAISGGAGQSAKMAGNGNTGLFPGQNKSATGILPITGNGQPGNLIFPDLSGDWSSNLGLTYQIQQQGNSFTWTSNIGEQGQGQYSGDRQLKHSWSGSLGAGSDTSRSLEVDAQNRATRIQWNNGVEFYRQASGNAGGLSPPPTPPGQPGNNHPNNCLTGMWQSSIGVSYQFAQQGPNFSWDAPALLESGRGHISGDQIVAEWTNPTGGSSQRGTVIQRDATGRPEKIQWDNGVVFYR